MRRQRAHPRAVRTAAALLALTTLAALTSGCTPVAPTARDAGSSAGPAPDVPARAQIEQLLTAAMERYHLQALIARVTVDGRDVYTGALGSSMAGVPATPAMHFRNGAVAFTYIGEILAILAGRHQLALDDPLARWLPTLPHASEITLRMLANMTSGYADYVYQPEVGNGVDADPFRQWDTTALIQVGVSRPLMFQPGTNWGYSHTNYLILGQVIEKVTGSPLATVMQDEVLGPMGLSHTANSTTAQLPEPALHSYTSERRGFLQVPPGTPFLEDSTYWNPSWTTAPGAVQSTDITDLATTAQQVGSGALVTPDMYQQQVGNRLVGVGTTTPDCPVCRPIMADRGYGLGVVLLGDWITQTKDFAGEGATMAYLPAGKLAVALVTTLTSAAYDDDGRAQEPTRPLLRTLAGALAPGHPAGPD